MVNTIHCAYCDKELERLVFCNASHKVMYHRKGIKNKETKPTTVNTQPHIIKNKAQAIHAVAKAQRAKDIQPCRHGLMYCATCM